MHVSYYPVSSYQAGLKYDVATAPSCSPFHFCIFAKFVSSSSSSSKRRKRFVSDECERWVDPASTFRGTRGFYEREEPPFEWDDLRAVASLGDEYRRDSDYGISRIAFLTAMSLVNSVFAHRNWCCWC